MTSGKNQTVQAVQAKSPLCRGKKSTLHKLQTLRIKASPSLYKQCRHSLTHACAYVHAPISVCTHTRTPPYPRNPRTSCTACTGHGSVSAGTFLNGLALAAPPAQIPFLKKQEHRVKKIKQEKR